VTAHPREVARIALAALVAMLCSACGTDQRDAEAKPTLDRPITVRTQDPTITSGQNTSDARIIVPDSYDGAGQRFHEVDEDTVRIFSTVGVAGICLDRPGRVTINEIQPEMSTGSMRVEAFALIPWDDPSDGGKIPLSRNPAFFARARDCNPHDPYGRNRGAAMAGLRLQVRMTGPQTAVAEQLVLHYTSGGHPYEFSFRYSIALCAPYDVTTRECEPPG
jgi:hypothetical protein